MSENYYPPIGFYFDLSISGELEKDTGSFLEVSGISAKMEYQQIKERGENRFVYKVPGRVSYDDLVLKRGLMRKDSAIAKWCIETLNDELNGSIEPKSLEVKLIDANGDNSNPIIIWRFINAYPINWSLSSLDSMNDEIVIESLAFTYSYFSL